MNNSNVRSKSTGTLELRKLWSVPEAKFIYALYMQFEQETCELEGTGKHKVPNWNKIVKHEKGWSTQQGFLGDEDWAKATAEHYGIDFPTEEYKGEHDEIEAVDESK